MIDTSDVVVVGAGPSGLASALQLGKAGVRVRLLERRRTPSDQPRAHVLNARTMELFRSWGVADGVREDGLAPELATSFGVLTELSGEEFGRLDIDEDATALYSTERLCNCPQDRIEARLLAAVRALPTVSVEFGHEVTGIDVSEDDVTVGARDTRGRTSSMSARFLIAADGAGSRLRDLTGIEMPRATPLGRRLNIYFHADLTSQVRSRPFILWFIHNVATQGIFISLDGRTRWVYSVEMSAGESADDYPATRCRALLRAALGVSDIEPDIRSTLTWTVGMGVADQFRNGPVFLVGDAAHTFPPAGGMGMNSGIQDAHNLAWKLTAVLNGQAGEKLLDTYEAERRPVAVHNATQSMVNARRQQEAARAMASPDFLALLASPEGGGLRAAVASGLHDLREEFQSLGQQFGYVYRSGALVDDGSPRRDSTVTQYNVTARPGARAPHVLLRDAHGDSWSSVQLFDGHWSLAFAGPAAKWAEDIEEAARVPVRTFSVHGREPTGGLRADDYLGLMGPEALAELYELRIGDAERPGGAVLVRPDGHVAARWQDGPQDVADVVRVMDAVLARASTA
ncbi:FAD-dependent monooxygenase [Streptomyces sp. NPDC059396]|uniref:FAD-dependent monooxygenase n=1 Tax=Streptomyces sp. NPDC059396 TaxID=3346819 RepID=UPI00368CD888